jgi:RNA polymerase sigma factor (sigma-70 family)
LSVPLPDNPAREVLAAKIRKMSSESSISTSRVESLLTELRAGRGEARAELLQATCDRLMALTRKLKRSFPQVGRWEQTEDVFQNSSLRLYQAMADVEIVDALHYYRLAALQIRRELIDLSRRYDGPHGLGRHHLTTRVTPGDAESRPPSFEAAEETHNPAAVAQWAEFHEAIEALPQDQREVTELIWYHGLSQEDAGGLLGVDARTVRRRWRAARMALHEHLQGELPSE